MILATTEKIDRYTKAGLWSASADKSIDGMLRRNAAAFPDRLALADAPDRAVWTGGVARSFTWRKLDRKVEAIATFFSGLGLSPSSVVAFYGTPTTDILVTSLAAHRAGLIAAFLPVFWREKELLAALSESQARIIVTSDRIETDRLALRSRSVAQDAFNIRFVLGFGDDLPDGVVELNSILDSEAEILRDASEFDVPDPNTIVTLHVTTLQNDDDECLVPRSSNQWLAAQRAAMESIRPARGMVSAYGPFGFAGYCCGLVTALRHAVPLHLHHFRRPAHLVDHAQKVDPDLCFLPEPLMRASEPDLWEDLKIARLWRDTVGMLSDKQIIEVPHNHIVRDILVLNEMVAFGHEPTGEAPPHVPVCELPQDKPSDLAATIPGAVSGEAARSGPIRGGELHVFGAGAPEVVFPSSNPARALKRLRSKGRAAAVPTGIMANLASNDPEQAIPIGFAGEVVARNGVALSANALDDLYRSLDGVSDAAHFIDSTDDSLCLAVVPEAHADITTPSVHRALASLGHADAKYPERVIRVDEIPRGVGGMVMRGQLMGDPQTDNDAWPLQTGTSRIRL